MSERIKVLIAEDNIEFSNLLNEQLGIENDIQVVGVAYDGNQALELMEAVDPDVVVLDIIMPNLDGIGLLEKIAIDKPRKKPYFIVLTAIGQEIFIKRAIELGADYYMVKPFNIANLTTRIRQIYKWNRITAPHTGVSIHKPSLNSTLETQGEIDVESLVTSLVRNIGIPMHKCGYEYIIEAITQTVKNSNYFGSVTKTLYPAIAQKYRTTPQKVERSIRHVIETTWIHGDQDSISTLFGNGVLNRCRPTNSEFIAMMADKVKLNMVKK